MDKEENKTNKKGWKERRRGVNTRCNIMNFFIFQYLRGGTRLRPPP